MSDIFHLRTDKCSKPHSQLARHPTSRHHSSKESLMQARCESQGMLQSFPLGSCLGSGSAAFDFDDSSLSRGCTKSSWSSRSHGLQLGPRTSTIFRKDASSCPLSTMNCARGPRQCSTRSRKCCRLLLLRLPSSSGATVSAANPETLHSLNSRSLQIKKS